MTAVAKMLLTRSVCMNSSHQFAYRAVLSHSPPQHRQQNHVRNLSFMDRFRRRSEKKSEEGLPPEVQEDVKALKKRGEDDPDVDVLADPLLTPRELSEEQVMEIRNKSMLPADVREEMVGEGMTPFEYAWQYEKKNARKAYALFGKASGLKPGIAWPRREELYHKMGYEKVFFPTLDKLLMTAAEKKAAKEKKLQDRENEVLENLKKLPKWKEQFFKEYLAKEKEMAEEKRKRERLIEEVREYLGYEVDIKDPRFQAALLRKEQEELKGRKTVSRAQQRKAAMLEELAKIAEAEMAKAQAKAEAKKKGQPESQAVSENQAESVPSSKDQPEQASETEVPPKGDPDSTK